MSKKPETRAKDAKESSQQMAWVGRFHGNRAELWLENGGSVTCHVHRQSGTLVAGDQVMVEAVDNAYTVVKRLPRQSELSRPDKYGKIRTLAANIDQLFIVVAVQPEPDLTLIDHYLVLSKQQNIRPLLLLNKVDQTDAAHFAALLEIEFEGLVDRLFKISTISGEGIPELISEMTGKVSVFSGQSGVGKSSLLNVVCPEAKATVGELNQGDGSGAHTTSTPSLYKLPTGGWIIDSPGIRELALFPLSANQLISGFGEFASLADRCRFRNCIHRNEPDCAVQQAVQEGNISARRYQNYLRALDTMGQ